MSSWLIHGPWVYHSSNNYYLRQTFSAGRGRSVAQIGRDSRPISDYAAMAAQLCRPSRSLQGNAVPPQPIVHCPDIASELRRDIFGTNVLLEVQVLKAPLGEDVTVSGS